MVKELDGEEITIVPSTVGKIVPDGTPEEEWEWAVESLTESTSTPARPGSGWRSSRSTGSRPTSSTAATQALALAEAVAPDVGICLDAFHMNIEEADLLEAIRAAGPKLYRLPRRRQQSAWRPAWARSTGRRSSARSTRSATTARSRSSSWRRSTGRRPTRIPTRSRPNPVDISPEEMQFIIDHGSSLLSESFYSMLVEQRAHDDPAAHLVSRRMKIARRRRALAALPRSRSNASTCPTSAGSPASTWR